MFSIKVSTSKEERDTGSKLNTCRQSYWVHIRTIMDFINSSAVFILFARLRIKLYIS